MAQKFDFSGWATKNNLRCSDGRTIRKDAFKDNDGQTVLLGVFQLFLMSECVQPTFHSGNIKDNAYDRNAKEYGEQAIKQYVQNEPPCSDVVFETILSRFFHFVNSF